MQLIIQKEKYCGGGEETSEGGWFHFDLLKWTHLVHWMQHASGSQPGAY